MDGLKLVCSWRSVGILAAKLPVKVGVATGERNVVVMVTAERTVVGVVIIRKECGGCGH